MLQVKVDINSIEKLDSHINYVKKLLTMQTDKEFQKYIQQKCLETVNKVSEQRLIANTTNDDAIGLYISNNKIRQEKEGFILYNDTKIPVEALGIQNSPENYPDGMFSIALAFEYGVGIIGSNTNAENHWEYNVQGYNFGWYIPRSVTGRTGVETAGYQGFEIYRFTAEEIKAMLPKWVNDYFNKKEVFVND